MAPALRIIAPASLSSSRMFRPTFAAAQVASTTLATKAPAGRISSSSAGVRISITTPSPSRHGASRCIRPDGVIPQVLVGDRAGDIDESLVALLVEQERPLHEAVPDLDRHLEIEQ